MQSGCFKCSVIFFSVLFALVAVALSISGWLLKDKLDDAMPVRPELGMVAEICKNVPKLPVNDLEHMVVEMCKKVPKLPVNDVDLEDMAGISHISNVLTGVITLGWVIFCLAFVGCYGVCTDSPKIVNAYGVVMAAVAPIQEGLVVVAIVKLQQIQQLKGMTAGEREAFTTDLIILCVMMSVLMVISGLLAMACWCHTSCGKRAEDLRQIAMMRRPDVPDVPDQPYVRIETLPAHDA